MIFARRAKLIKHLRHRTFREFARRDAVTRLRLTRELAALRIYHQQGTSLDFTDITQHYASNIIDFSRTCSSYYRESLKGLPKTVAIRSNVWESIPTVTRNTVREAREIIRTLPLSEIVGTLTTGGSTGEPLAIDYLGGHDGEHQEFLWRLHGYISGESILAMDGTLVPDELRSKGVYWTKKSDSQLPYGGYALSSHYLNKESVDNYLDYLTHSTPDYIRGYPSFIAEIAGLLIERETPLSINGVELTSESHTPQQVTLIERALGPCLDQYGHAEAALFAYTAPGSDELFCAPTYGFVEILDESGNHVAPGESGEVTVTGFHNYAMPLIRYRTGDHAVFKEIRDGITVLSQVEGREQDVVYSPDGTPHRLTALIFGRHYAAFDRITRWQIIQKEPGRVDLHIIRTKDYSPADEAEIRGNFLKLANIECYFYYVENIPRSARGKSRFLIQEVQP